jgi:hypothetical protein
VANIRPARTTDVFAITEILVAQQARSRYAGIVAVDEPYTRKMLAQAIQRHGGTNDGATLVNVVEYQGEVVAFMMGVLQRVYNIGVMLEAYDVHLARHPNSKCPIVSSIILLQQYVDWAQHNPKVVDINLTHSDVTPESRRMAEVYEGLGFVRHGGLYRLGVTET